MYSISGETTARHSCWLMLAVSFAHSMSGDATAGHRRTVPSWLALASRCPSGLNTTSKTWWVWPVSGAPIGWPVSAFHTRTVLSALAEASSMPVGAEHHSVHRGLVAGEPGDRFAGVDVPQPHRAVVAGAGQPVPVRAERHTVDTCRCGR